MKKVVVVEPNALLKAGESTNCIILTAGAANDQRVVNRGETVLFSFPVVMKAARSDYSFMALGETNILEGLVPLITLSSEMILKDAELVGAFIEDDTLFAKIRFNSGIKLLKRNEMLKVRFLEGSVRFIAVTASKSKKGRK